jgi:AcrR family transcriptional regulator
MVQFMSYIAERRGEEKERRRSEILDAAEALYAQKGWDAVTMDQVARSARLSRALVYERFAAAAAAHGAGMDQVEAIGRAYMGYAHEFPHYFDFMARFQAHAASGDPGSNEAACHVSGDLAIGVLVNSIQTGKGDGSIRADVGEPLMLAITLWAFTHGVIQLTMSKGHELARMGVATPALAHYAFAQMRVMAQARPGS